MQTASELQVAEVSEFSVAIDVVVGGDIASVLMLDWMLTRRLKCAGHPWRISFDKSFVATQRVVFHMRYELRVEVSLGWGIVKSLSALILGRFSQMSLHTGVDVDLDPPDICLYKYLRQSIALGKHGLNSSSYNLPYKSLLGLLNSSSHQCSSWDPYHGCA